MTKSTRFLLSRGFDRAQLPEELFDVPAQMTSRCTPGWRDRTVLSPPRERSWADPYQASSLARRDEPVWLWHRPDCLIRRVRRDLLARLTRSASISRMARLARRMVTRSPALGWHRQTSSPHPPPCESRRGVPQAGALAHHLRGGQQRGPISWHFHQRGDRERHCIPSTEGIKLTNRHGSHSGARRT
jgi:hypothetical protein